MATRKKVAKATTRSKKAPASAKATKLGTKTDTVIEMLRRPGGATLDAIMKATGWQSHSVRGFIAGTIRKKLGLTVTSTREEDGARTYSIEK